MCGDCGVERSIGIPQPYHLPGYTGTCPGVQYCLGKSFGLATHLTIHDPTVSHSNKLAFSRFKVDDLGEDFETSRQLKMSKVKERLEQEVMLLKGTRRPRSIHDRMMIDSPRLPLTTVSVVCKGYKRNSSLIS